MFSQPTVPFELYPEDMPADWQAQCDKLWREVLAELCDDDYLWQAHYKRHTYDSGCRGPLCRKFVRDASRSRPRSTRLYQPREGRVYDPIIDFYKIVALLQMEARQLQLQEQLKETVK